MESQVNEEMTMMSKKEPIDTSSTLGFFLAPSFLKLAELRVSIAKDPESLEKALEAVRIAQNLPIPTLEQHQKWFKEQQKHLGEVPEAWNKRDPWTIVWVE
ncbi:hypothetical protein CEP52_017759 [Fusarium oligoseptatum]|uniref:Uncharacterized protein n=1 Tax=Fusarium oligoseptatum TaxID=2604345 RepID=A0A428RHA1_9HYPO|nr:hypothetical protein CEP52_017759 [Fusarium oligoseptatum]